MPDEHICPTCGGSGEGVTYDSGGAASGWDCPDCGGSGKAENSITANEAQPLHLTLEEAMAAVDHPGWYLQRRTYDDAPDEWLVVDRFGGIRGTGHTWPEAVSAALGRPVVARDDAAELRAALAKMSDLVFTMLSAEDELSRAKGPGGSYPEDVAGYHAARRNAWEELCSLAQEHDDPDALRAALAKWKERS